MRRQAFGRLVKKKELNRGRWEVRETKVFRIEDGVELGFPGGRAIVRTFRRTWKTRRTKARNKDGAPIRNLVGEPTKEVVYHVTSLDADSRPAGKFAETVRTHWYVEVYHGKRDNGYHEDVLTRRCDESLMSAAMVARSFGMWICARHSDRTTEQARRDLWEHPAKLVRIMLKGGLL